MVKTGDDTTISRIVKLIQEAQEEKAPAQRFIERFAEIFVPAVIVLSILALIITRDVTNSLTLFVVACPCALVISTPVAVVSGLGNAAKQGILIKGGVALEQMGKVKTVVFDKTGTLTMGEHGVAEIFAVSGASEEDILELAALAEQRSEHPISRAIMDDARRRGIETIEPEAFQVIKGKGVIAKFNRGRRIMVGNGKLLEEASVPVPLAIRAQAERMETRALTVFFVAEGERIMGIIGTSDMERPEARWTIASLKKMKIRTIMLSGDNATTVKVLGERLGVDEAYGNLLPEEKVNHIKRLQKRGKVGMVGDGINDAPALATADIGIAMGGKGSQLTIETSDITLLSDDLTRVVAAIKLSRKTLNVIKQNTGFALLVVLGLVLSAFFGLIGLAIGVIGHEASALIVVANSMRLIRRKEKKGGHHHDGDDGCGSPAEHDGHNRPEEDPACGVDGGPCGCSH